MLNAGYSYLFAKGFHVILNDTNIRMSLLLTPFTRSLVQYSTEVYYKIHTCPRYFLGRTAAVEKHLPAPAQPQGSRLNEDCLLHFTFLYKKYPLIPPQCDIMNLLSATPARKPQMIVCRALANRQAHNLHKSAQKQS